MGGEQDRRAGIREATQVGEESGAGGGIKTRGRFVEKEHVRVGQQLDRDACPFALTAAQGADSQVALRSQVQPVERLVDELMQRLGRRGGRHPELRRVSQRRDQREFHVDDVVLGHVTHRATYLHEVRCRIDPVERDRPLVRRTDARDRFKQRGLSRAAPTHDGNKLTRLDRERDLVEHTLTIADRFRQTAHLDP